jgi:hypothetical protein
MGSFIYISNAKAPSAPGGVVQSLDVLDYSVIHLSAYERLMKRHGKRLPKQSVNVTEKMSEVSNILRNTTLKRHSAILSKQSKQETHRLLQVLSLCLSLSLSLSLSLTLSVCLSLSLFPSLPFMYPFQLLNRTVAMMPFLGFTNGAGHSVLGNRFQYLHACFWSIYAYFPHIIVAVNSKADYHYCRSLPPSLPLSLCSTTSLSHLTTTRNTSGLPFFDVLLLDQLPKPASLPVATSFTVKARIIDGTYDFDHFYFTESDQACASASPCPLTHSLDADSYGEKPDPTL